MDLRDIDRRLDEVLLEVRAIRTTLIGMNGGNGLLSSVRKLEEKTQKHAANWSKLMGFGAGLSLLGGAVGAGILKLLGV